MQLEPRNSTRLQYLIALRGLIALTAAWLLPASTFADDGKNYSQETARPAPAWVRDGVVYEIFPRNFSSAGTFEGITSRLDELHEMGVSILWLMPIHPSGKLKSKGTYGSPYAVQDYYAVDPSLGTEDDLKRLVAEAHQRGMKVIIDLVANHTAWDSVLMAHPEFYKHDAHGNIIPPDPEWTDVAGLDYSNAALREYMITMLRHWIDPNGVNLDGYRCDAADRVPTDFWEQARAELVKTKPDITLFAEANSPVLMVKAFDLDYSWSELSALNKVLLDSAPATEFKRAWDADAAKFPRGTLHARISDDHDEARAVAKYGIRGALAASVLMFSLDGVPLLYNGMETGDATESGAPALFEKMPVYWHSKERPPLREIYRGLINLRKQYPAFRNDRVIWLRNSDENDVVSLMRLDEHDEFVTVINFSNRPVVGQIEVLNASEFTPVTPAAKQTPPGFPLVALKGFEYRVYHRHVR